MRQRFDSRRDQATADHAVELDGRGIPLRCVASGCPNRWSVEIGATRTCSAHSFVDAREWPRIKQEQLDADADLALANAAKIGQPLPFVPNLTRADKVAILDRLRRAVTEPKPDARQWARDLERRERNGERLTLAQREAWREALATSRARVDEAA